MGLLTLNQFPCHHVLANEIALNLKYRLGLKHFFNINLGIGIIKKTTFFFVCIFDISPCVFTQISIGRARWMRDDVIISFFQVFLVFGVAGSVKSMPNGYSMDAKLNSASNEYPLVILLMDLATPNTRNT